MDDTVYDTVMDTNVRGLWNYLRHEIAATLESGGGAVVNTASVGGLVAIPQPPHTWLLGTRSWG
ncbi:hypothetical protein [Streptomyces sp. 549]|uniref:hypothetical protein n=1 Tax=Streptomyces sp. 549 TaxID=3049076 RepID=UPI0032E36872